MDALIADNRMRQRDERFATQVRHKAKPDPLYDKSAPRDAERRPSVYQPRDFQYDPVARTCICPAGKSLYARCLRDPATVPAR